MAVDWDATVLAPTMAVFGEPGTYTPLSGAAYPLAGVFDAAYREIDQITGELAPLESAIPVVGVRRAAMQADAVQGDRWTCTATGIVYMVKAPVPDSHGHILLKLGRVSA